MFKCVVYNTHYSSINNNQPLKPLFECPFLPHVGMNLTLSSEGTSFSKGINFNALIVKVTMIGYNEITGIVRVDTTDFSKTTVKVTEE